MEIFVLKSEEIAAIARGTHGNPHHILGMHCCLDDCYVNAYYPDAEEVTVVRIGDDAEFPMSETGAKGFFTVKIENSGEFSYRLRITRKVWGESGEDKETRLVYDPYSFGYSVDLAKVMDVVRGDDDIESGFHVKELFGTRQIALDGIQGTSFCMNMPGAVRVSVVGDFNGWNGRINPMRKIDYTDIFELFIPGDLMNTRYKFEALYRDGDIDIFADPYAVAYEVAPGNASMLTELSYKWSDQHYMENRKCDGCVNIYEVHMPTWKSPADGQKITYVQFGRDVAAYARSMGYNYIQFMPLMEYRDDNGWGYDTVGMFAPTSRFGSPAEFMAMVDHLHSKGIGVIMDMVSVDDVDCLSYWIDTYHLDGIRLENAELVKRFRSVTGDRYNDVMVGMSWNSIAVDRITDYMMIPPANRGDFADYTCGITFNEADKSTWPLSHDGVSYERGSYASKMPGGYEDKYADLRVLFGMFMSLPGRKLTFMGQELGGFAGFDGKTAVDWSVLDFDANSYFQKYVKELNKLYNSNSTLNSADKHQDIAFVQDGQVMSFVRHGEKDSDNLYIVCNFGLKDVRNFKLSVEKQGKYKEIFSSDNVKFGGEGNNNKGYKTEENGVIEIAAPALSFAVFGMR